MFSEAQIQFFVDQVNKNINIPIFGEKMEAILIRRSVDKVLLCLEENLPEEMLRQIDDMSDGIEPGNDLGEIKSNTVEFLNKEINLPIVGEKFEAELFTEVVHILFEAMMRDKQLIA